MWPIVIFTTLQYTDSRFSMPDRNSPGRCRSNLNNEIIYKLTMRCFSTKALPLSDLNFVLGWTFITMGICSFSGSRSSFFQNGKCLQIIAPARMNSRTVAITFGPDNEGGYYGTNHRMNRNAILASTVHDRSVFESLHLRFVDVPKCASIFLGRMDK
jgi:hypothetical protein